MWELSEVLAFVLSAAAVGVGISSAPTGLLGSSFHCRALRMVRGSAGQVARVDLERDQKSAS